MTAKVLPSKWPQKDGKVPPKKLPALLVSLSKESLQEWDLTLVSTSSKLLTLLDVPSFPSVLTCGKHSLPYTTSPSRLDSNRKSLNTLTNTTHTSAPAKLRLMFSPNSSKPPPTPSSLCLDAPLLLKKLPSRDLRRRTPTHERAWDHQGLTL